MRYIDVDELLRRRESAGKQPLYPAQEKVLRHDSDPLWVIAGPGTGKTECLIWRCLRLLVVDDGVEPGNIIVTTFTERAARELQERIAEALHHVGFGDLDIAMMRVGTIHSLCNDILIEHRYPGYQGVQLMNEVEQHFFVYDRCRLARESTVWDQIGYPFRNVGPYGPVRWELVRASVALLNRLVEDQVDLDRLRRSRRLGSVAEAYDQYREALNLDGTGNGPQRCDFANLQGVFLEFLNNPSYGQSFMLGDPSRGRSPILHVLVDEYQDTNPIQEEIYFTLAGPSKNLVVVGDDDQALYRFRGGTVRCLIDFPGKCQRRLGLAPAKEYLDENRRSHKHIVRWVNKFISSRREMRMAGARAGGKPEIQPRASVTGDYPAVRIIQVSSSSLHAGDVMAELVAGLDSNGLVADLSQVAVLLPSTRGSARPIVRRLRNALGDDRVYNPRSGSFTDHPEVRLALGALVTMLDQDLSVLQTLRARRQLVRGVWDAVNQFVSTYDRDRGSYLSLSRYVEAVQRGVERTPQGDLFPSNIKELFYQILALEPFASWAENPERTVRLGYVSKVLDSFAAIHYEVPRMSDSEPRISSRFLAPFYNSLIGYIFAVRLNEVEDPENLIPAGQVQVMTIHGSKGLQFPYVLVSNLDRVWTSDEVYFLEELFEPYRLDGRRIRFSRDQRHVQDWTRLFFVAYSRAQCGLVIIDDSAVIDSRDTMGLPEDLRRLLRSRDGALGEVAVGRKAGRAVLQAMSV